jgi:hypothetical protein
MEIYQIYYTSDERVKNFTYHGFGDFIRGCVFLYYYCKENNINLHINFSKHHLNTVFCCRNDLSQEEIDKTKLIIGDNIIQDKYIFTNNWPSTSYFINGHRSYYITDDCRKFIIHNCLTPRFEFRHKFSEFKQSLNIMDDYDVIHVRLEDNETYNEDRKNRLVEIINKIPKTRPLVYVSSSKIYNDHIPYNIIKTNLNGGHLGLPTTTQEQTINTMLEFTLLTSCINIYQLSVYSWGSGFSDIVSIIYNKDVIRMTI